jgi:hypothetical protein
MSQPASPPLSDSELARLVKLARLLGSDHLGERAAAALKIHELISGRTDWEDLLRPPPQPVVVAAPPPRTWVVVVEEILANHYNALRGGNEVGFVTGLLERGWAPSEAQGCWLADVSDRCGLPLWEHPPPPSPEVRRKRRLARQAARMQPRRPTP